MFAYVVRRLLSAIPTLFIIVALAFFMMRIAPGGPFDGQRKLPPEIEHNMKVAYNLDKPVYVQFFKYLKGVLHGDFGPSFKNKDFTVSQLIGVGAPVSMILGVLSLSIALVLGLIVGGIAALRQNTIVDFSLMSIAMIGITIPTFVIAPLSILIFAVWLHWLPAGDWSRVDPLHLILPVTTLVLPQLAFIARLARGSILEVLRSNFVRTAHAKGLPDWKILWRHVLRASLLPLVSFLGPAAAGVMTGSLIVERIFGLPGIGRYFVEGALNRDYTVAMGVVIIYAIFIVALNLLSDLAYGWLDPKVRYD
ncbi:MAG TPA: ABC transporter permease subunit [Alphaproteobacteria bacterium]|nr:ABC transporter permease subunit [Alphaproteobacteria bacterium]